MPLHDVGYRPWQGTRMNPFLRWITIALTGIRLVWRGTWIRRTAILTWIPAIVLSFGFLLYEQMEDNGQAAQMVNGWIRFNPKAGEIVRQVMEDPETARHDVWAALLLTFFRYPQLMVMVIYVGLISPRLISFDLRSKAYLLYFSRPLKPWEYILGKASVIWFYLALITMLPALLMYLLGLMLARSPNVFLETWDLPLRIIVASAVMAIPTSLLALAYSAMTLESRYAAFAWLSTWVLGIVTYLSLGGASSFEQPRPRRHRGQVVFDDEMAQRAMQSWEQWDFVSPYHVLGRVEQYVFGFREGDPRIFWYFIALAIVSVICMLVIRHRIRGFLRA